MSIQVTKKYQRSCHKTPKGCRGRAHKSRDSDKKPLRSVLRTDIVRSRQTGVHKIVPRPQNISFRSRESAIQQNSTDPEHLRTKIPKVWLATYVPITCPKSCQNHCPRVVQCTFERIWDYLCTHPAPRSPNLIQEPATTHQKGARGDPKNPKIFKKKIIKVNRH